MIPDKLLINLKILSKIQKNGKITRSYDGIISLDSETIYQPIRRFITSDSRKQAVFEINSIVTECNDTFTNILNSKYMNKHYYNTDEFRKNCENLHLLSLELDNARIGVENLKFTYQNDQTIVSQLDIIILKMTTNYKDVTNKLIYYQSFLPNYAYVDSTTNQVLDSIKVETTYQNEQLIPYDNNQIDMNDV